MPLGRGLARGGRGGVPTFMCSRVRGGPQQCPQTTRGPGEPYLALAGRADFEGDGTNGLGILLLGIVLAGIALLLIGTVR